MFWANGTAYSSGGTGGGGAGTGGTFYYTDVLPSSPEVGDRWFDTSVGILFTYTDEGNSVQWIEAAASGFLGQTGYTGSMSNAQGYTGSIGYAGSASTVAGYTGSTGAGYTGSVGQLSYTGILDGFTGDGATVAFALSVIPRNINNTTINLNGVIQLKSSYTLLNNVITFSEAPPVAAAIEITTQVYGPAYTPFLTWLYTSSGGNTFTVSNGVTNDSVLVMANGVVQRPVTDYAISGSTLTMVGTVSPGVVIHIRELPGAIQGDTGYVGSTGSLGYTGSTGIGYTGSSSTVIGYTGSQGITGAVTYTVTSPTTSAFVINGASNPTITLARGYTYYFDVGSEGFIIKTIGTTGASDYYNSGVTNNGGSNSRVTFTVPYDAPATLYYVSYTYSSMAGVFQIFDLGQTGYSGSAGYAGSSGAGYTGSSGGISAGKSIAMTIVFGG